MKISEIINETKETIRTYWGLFLRNTESMRATFEEWKRLGESPLVNGKLLELISHLDEWLRDPSWQNFESDPDFDQVYDELLDLYDEINQFLKQ